MNEQLEVRLSTRGVNVGDGVILLSWASTVILILADACLIVILSRIQACQEASFATGVEKTTPIK